MTFPTCRPCQHLRSLAMAACMLTATLSHAQLGQAALARLAALQASPESAGALVYRGATFAQRAPAGDPLYRYERRVLPVADGLNASHLTSDPAGRVIIVESATLSAHHALQRFEAVNQQAGLAGWAQLSPDGRHLTYELNDNGKISTATEEVSDPVISGPSMFGFILKHWESLRGGASLPVRMLVLKDTTTYGFEVKHEKQANGHTSFTVTPTSFLIRMAVAPLRVVFDTNTRTPVRYEGRVPPMEHAAGKLKDLDARVEYTAITPAYR